MAIFVKTFPVVAGGKFVDQYAIVDENGDLVGSKAHRTIEEAESELASLKFYDIGLEFAKETAPEGTNPKTLVGKANVVAAYLAYKEAKEAPVQEADATEEVAEQVEQTVAGDEEF